MRTSINAFSKNDIPMRILITGAGGLLGTPLSQQVDNASDLIAQRFTRTQLDITDRNAVIDAMKNNRPDWVINCAAFTKVDDCEANETHATLINGVGAVNVATAAAAVEAGLVHISTDYVFDGTARMPISTDATTGPTSSLSAYGRSKLAGEQAVREHHPNPTIVRTAWVYGSDGPCFPRAILRLAREGKLKQVVDDQRGAPTYAPDLAEAIIRLIRANARGTFHVTNSDSCTWFEFATVLLDLAGIDLKIEPCTTVEFPRPAKRPAYSVLDLHAYHAATGHQMRSWRAAAAAYIDSIR